MKLLLALLLSLSLYADYYADNLPSTDVFKMPTVEDARDTGTTEPPKPYYPTQTEPAPGVMHDYRAPTYDIYKYDLAPVN